ncbi:hypothetical protein ACHWQZ_G015038 [Mnemiopsis leidyi]
MKKRRLLAPLVLGTITNSLTAAQNSLLGVANSSQNDQTSSTADHDQSATKTLTPAEVFLIVSPVIAVVIMGLVLAGIVIKNRRETTTEEKKVKYEEFVDIENVTENVELMVQNREGFS